MSNYNDIFACLSFQPNSAIRPQGAGLVAGFFGLPMRQSASIFMVGGMAHSGMYQPASAGLGIGGGMQQGGIARTQLTGRRQEQGTLWFTGKTFINKSDKGKHYSRPIGLPPLPPPGSRRRSEQEGGTTAS